MLSTIIWPYCILSRTTRKAGYPSRNGCLSYAGRARALLFVAHAGKSKQQRGTSKKEDVMDVVIKLGHTQDYQP